uniref:SLC26A/SulP transporter domain-containing protein n=1 Tax=Alexandrium andersonii TaxID=327968 RepID=A0A7S2F2H0_9DINO
MAQALPSSGGSSETSQCRLAQHGLSRAGGSRPARLRCVKMASSSASTASPKDHCHARRRHWSELSWFEWFVGRPSISEFFELEEWRAMPTQEKLSFVKNEVLLGITICFAQIPESVAFAFMAHIKPHIAIHAAWVVGLICSLFGGRTGMVNGAEGAFAAIIATMIPPPAQQGGNGAGIELLFPSVMTCGAFMLLIWLTGTYKFITLVPASVMLGFCNGLAIVIGLSQLHPFQEHGHDGGKHWVTGQKMWWMLLEMITAMLIMEFVPKIPCKAAKVLPSSLLSILSSILIEFVLVRNVGGRTDVIGDVSKFKLTYPYPFFLHEDYDYGLVTRADIPTVILQGALLAIAGIVQGLLTTEVVYDFVKTPTNQVAVCLSCGIANIVSGFLGGMGGDAMIGLSTINCLNGGRGRLGPVVTALGIAACMHGGYPLLNFIPVASLAGVMIVVVLHTFKWFSVPLVLAALLPQRWRATVRLPEKVDRFDMFVVAIVTAMVVLANLVYAVGAGLALSGLRYAWDSSLSFVIQSAPGDVAESKVYHVHGRLFFGTAMRFHTYFDYVDDPDTVVLCLDSAPADYSANTALAKVEGLYKKEGKTCQITFTTPSYMSSPCQADINQSPVNGGGTVKAGEEILL